MTHDTTIPRLAPRRLESHKGDFGRALLIGGSWGMSGAIALAGMSCLRGGAGLVKLATPEICLAPVAAIEPCYMTIPLKADAQGHISLSARDALEEAAEIATAVAIGPGLGRSDELTELVGWLYQILTKPLVVDADALNALAAQRDVLSKHAGPRILTPHPGEFCRLYDCERVPIDKRESMAVELAQRSGAIIVLKGANTVVTDSSQVFINTTGNPGMATGGTGDVLTGLTTAMLCQGLNPYDAAKLAVYVHGLAGDLAAAAIGEVGMIARDLITHLPDAVRVSALGEAASPS